jgi:hypothetical protein
LYDLRFSTVVVIKSTVFWDITMCNPLAFYRPHSIIFQKTELFMFHILDLITSSDVQEEMFLLSWAANKELALITRPPEVQNIVMFTVTQHLHQKHSDLIHTVK